jgi:hypothetical protein
VSEFEYLPQVSLDEPESDGRVLHGPRFGAECWPYLTGVQLMFRLLSDHIDLTKAVAFMCNTGGEKPELDPGRQYRKCLVQLRASLRGQIDEERIVRECVMAFALGYSDVYLGFVDADPQHEDWVV